MVNAFRDISLPAIRVSGVGFLPCFYTSTSHLPTWGVKHCHRKPSNQSQSWWHLPVVLPFHRQGKKGLFSPGVEQYELGLLLKDKAKPIPQSKQNGTKIDGWLLKPVLVVTSHGSSSASLQPSVGPPTTLQRGRHCTDMFSGPPSPAF